MAARDEEESRVSLVDMVISRKTKLIFFVLNLALVIPYAVKNYSHWGFVGLIAILVIAFYSTVVKPDTDTPACRDLPLLLFFDVCAYLAVSYRALTEHFDTEYLGIAFGGDYIVLIILCLLVSWFASRKRAPAWISFLCKTTAGAALVMQIWSEGDFFEPIFYENGDSLLAFFLLCSIVWYVLCLAAKYVEPASFKRNKLLTNILLAVFFVLCAAETQIVQDFADGLQYAVLTIPTESFAWGKVIFAAMILIACAVAAYDYLDDTMGVDALILGLTASGIVLLKVLMCNYFSLNWVVFLIFLVGGTLCMRNEQRGTKTLGLSSLVYLTVQFAVLLAAVLLLSAGLWMNVIVIGVYTLVFCTTTGKEKREKHELLFWLTVLSAPVVYAISHIWHTRFAMETVVMILLVFAVSVGTMIILNWPHPDQQKTPKGFKIAICVFLALLCWISMGRYGAKVNVEFDVTNNTAIIEVEAKGKGNSIASVEYYWSSLSGKMVGNEKKMSVNGAVIPVKSEKLTVVATDQRGVVTTKTAWYPDWLRSDSLRRRIGQRWDDLCAIFQDSDLRYPDDSFSDRWC